MKAKAFLALALCLSSLSSQAAVINKINRYLHIPTNRVVELDNINTQKGTATYFDYALGKRITVNLSDVSKETKTPQDGVKAGDYVFTYTDQGAQICKTWLVFENASAQIGCRSGQTSEMLGPTRMTLTSYIGKTKNLLLPTTEANGFSRGETVLLKDKKMKIKEIFESGYVLLISANVLTKLDTTESIIKVSSKIVHVNDIQKL